MANALTKATKQRLAGTGQRPRRDRVTITSAIWLIVLLVGGVVTLPVSLKWYNVQELDVAVRHPPSIRAVVPLAMYVASGNEPGEKSGALITIAHGASSIFGHDDLGRSLFYRILPGALVSLGIGLAAAMIAAVVGTLWGAVSALCGGRVDLVMMRVVDVLFGLPYVLMVILMKIGLTGPLTALLGGQSKLADLAVLFLAIGLVSWLTMARVVRGQVLSLRTRGYVDAARAAGAGRWHILRRHMLPNLVGPVSVYAALVVPQAILQEAFLSFLGIGVQQPTPSLGRLAADGVQAVNTFVGYWWLIVFPCGILVVTLLSLNFLGDAFRERFDPKGRSATLV